MMNGFTRQEALKLTGTPTGSASYWDYEGIIAPTKLGNPRRPTVIYTAEQVYQLLLVSSLKEQFPLQQIRKLLELDLSVPTTHLVLIDGEPFALRSPQEFWQYLLELHQQDGEAVRVRAIGDLTKLLKPLQRVDEILDFDKRVSGTVLQDLKQEKRKQAA